MINLLPPEIKESYRFAHRNVSLLRWVAAFGISLVILEAISTVGVIYIQQTALSYTSTIATTQASLKAQKLDETQAQVKDLSDNLKLAVQVLSKEVLFSELLTQLATITPSNASLIDLTIAQTQKSIDITAMTADYATATQLQVNLTDPANKLFTKADIVNISCGSGAKDPSILAPLLSGHSLSATTRSCSSMTERSSNDE